jgi:ribonuclease HI
MHNEPIFANFAFVNVQPRLNVVVPEKKLKHVALYTNGVCSLLSGPSGYGVVLRYGNHRKELSGGFKLTTSDRMELTAAIAALETLETRCNVTLYTNSRLLAEGVSKERVETLRKEVWKNTNRRAPNLDLWKQLAKLIEKHTIQVILMKIYLEDREYERAVDLTKQATQHRCFNIDAVYVKIRAQKESPPGVPGQKPRFIRKK